jgi:hypothetical protein
MYARMVLGTGLLTLALAGLVPAPAAPPIDKLLPDTTREVIQITDLPSLNRAWPKTQFGKLAADPAMKDFFDSLGVAGWLPGPVPSQIELSPEDLDDLASGGAGWAFVHPPGTKGAQILWMDTTGKAKARAAWTERLAEKIKKAGGRMAEEKIGGVGVTMYEIFKGKPVYALTRDDLLVLTDNRSVLEGVIGRWATGAESLAQVPAYQTVTKRLGPAPAELRYYLDPLGRMEMMRAANPIPKGKGKEKDVVSLLRKHGIDGIKGVGASVRLAAGQHDIDYRIFVHAPPPLRGGLGLVRLMPGKEFTPDPWVPAELATFYTLYLDFPAAWEAVGPVFDALAPGAEEGTFKELVEKMEKDPKGPQVNLRKDIVDRLVGRVMVVNPISDPKDEKKDRVLIVLPIKQAEGLKKTLHAMFSTDPEVTSQMIGRETMWVVKSEAHTATPGKPPQPPSRTGICVANGHLYLSTRPSMIEDSIRRGAAANPLAGNADYKRVAAEMEKAIPPDARVALRIFARPAEEYLDLYEAARLKKQPQVETTGWSVLSLFLGKVLTGDLGKLPPYAKIAPYLGPAGIVGTLHDDGWELRGFNLPR